MKDNEFEKPLEHTNQWLPAHGVQFLKDNVKYHTKMLPDTHGDLHEVEVADRVVVGTYGPWNQWELHQYFLKDGSTVKEFLQSESLGDHKRFFIGMLHYPAGEPLDDDGNKKYTYYAWSYEKINSYKT